MKTDWLYMQPTKWLIMVLLVLLATLTLAFQTSQDETDPAHCHSCKPPTPTYTPTPTSIPPLQACRVVAVEFDKVEYLTSDPINITLRVEDAAGAPLIGANVDATVSRQPFTDTLEASAIPPLEDQSGTYDGIYTQTDLPGIYTFKFDVSDFTGPRFLPCSVERTVRVKEPSKLMCTVTVVSNTPSLNETIDLTVTVTISDVVQSGAVVTATVKRPDDTDDDPINFSGSGSYTGHYPNTDLLGNYTFQVIASDPARQFSSCSTPITVPVTAPDCTINLDAAPNPLTLGNTLGLTATLTNTICADASTIIQRPNGITETVPFSGTGNICTAPYTPISTGTYTLTGAATSPGGSCYSQPREVRVDPPIVTPTLQLTLPSRIDLCATPSDIGGAVVVSNVTNLSQVQLDIAYNPTFMQVIDNTGRPQPPVEIKSLLPADWLVTENRVDTANGHIFFKANGGTSISGVASLVQINWRLQGRTGITPITIVATLTDASGGRTISQTQPLEIIIDSICLQGVAQLQGRIGYSGITVTGLNGEQAQTFTNGLFAIAATGPFSFTYPGYLPAQTDLPYNAASQPITLLAGDVNADNLINILDMTYLAGHYLSTDAMGDLNGDGIVNILDLTLVASNYQRRGPLTSWQ